MPDPIESAATALATDPARAEREARALCARMPGDPRVLLIVASAQRRLGRADEALPVLQDLAQRWPNAMRTRYELGLTLAALDRRDDGLAQLERAVTLDPKFRDGWQAIADLTRAGGDSARERVANARLVRLDRGDGVVGQAAEALALGEPARAEALLLPHCRAHSGDGEAVHLLALCRIAVSAFYDAESLLRHALVVKPDLTAARYDLASVLHARSDGQAALTELTPLLQADPDNPVYLNMQASCLMLLGDEDRSEGITGALARRFPDNPHNQVNHGRVLRVLGRRGEAIAAYRQALSVKPTAGDAWWALANLKLGTLDGPDGAAMRAALAGPLANEDRLAIEYAMGRCAEDAGQFGASFTHYQAGAALARAAFTFDPMDHTRRAVAAAHVYTRAFLAQREDWGVDDAAPIFIVGMPRSGSTLVEQILSCHPAVEGTMEMPYIPLIAEQVARAGGPQALSREDVTALGAQYLLRAQVHRRQGRAHFIDKMPGNFLHIGLIRLILPHARIIDVRRHPMASCFSNFKQLFSGGQEYSYDLGDLAGAYRAYLGVIRHFREVAPGAAYTLIYEDLVDDTEGQVRRLLDHCGLPFDPATLRFFENDRAVRTVSSEQVRQPIYRSGLDQWRAFEAHLAPLAVGLGDALEGWRG